MNFKGNSIPWNNNWALRYLDAKRPPTVCKGRKRSGGSAQGALGAPGLTLACNVSAAEPGFQPVASRARARARAPTCIFLRKIHVDFEQSMSTRKS